MREMRKINYGWAKRFDRLYEIMQGSIVYMDMIAKVQSKTSTQGILEIRINDFPYPEPRIDIMESVESFQEFSANVTKWMGSSIEVCFIDVADCTSKEIADIWEPCSFGCLMMASGMDVMVARRKRWPVNDPSGLGITPIGHPSHPYKSQAEERVYEEMSRMMSRTIAEMEDQDELPAARKMAFEKDRLSFAKKMDLDI